MTQSDSVIETRHRSPTRRLFIRNLEVPASIGVHAHELRGAQPIKLSVDLWVRDDNPADDLKQVVDYAAVARIAREVIASRHFNLVETLSEAVAGACLADPRVTSVRVLLEKPHALAEAECAGVEIIRHQP